MNNHLFYCRSFQIIYYCMFSKEIDIILADRLELWTSILPPATDNCPSGENDRRNCFMINLNESYMVGLGLELAILAFFLDRLYLLF